MRIELKEFKDEKGEINLALLNLIDPIDDDSKNETNWKILDAYILKYVESRNHNIYKHIRSDSLSAIITFNIDEIESHFSDI
jgi:hypothetical protein